MQLFFFFLFFFFCNNFCCFCTCLCIYVINASSILQTHFKINLTFFSIWPNVTGNLSVCLFVCFIGKKKTKQTIPSRPLCLGLPHHSGNSPYSNLRKKVPFAFLLYNSLYFLDSFFSFLPLPQFLGCCFIYSSDCLRKMS